ncbi:MAG: hypothetical protein WAK95_02925 [Desulfobacterales bacterium]
MSLALGCSDGTRHQRPMEGLGQPTQLQGRVISLQVLIEQAAHHYKIEPENLKSASKERRIVEARRAFCFMAVRLGSRLLEIVKIKKKVLTI